MTVFRRPLVVINKIIAYKEVIDLNCSRSLSVKKKKKSVHEKFLKDSQKTDVLYKMVELEDALISNKAQLEHETKPFPIHLISFWSI